MDIIGFDIRLFNLINKGASNDLFDFLMPLLSNYSYYFLLPYFLYILWLEYKKIRSREWNFLDSPTFALIVAFFSFILADWLTNELKQLLGRARPCITLADVRLLVGCTASFSLPSSHAANSFAILLTLYYFTKRNVSIWAILYLKLLALLIGFSRVYVGVHYPSDVLMGALWGSLTSVFVIFIVKITLLNERIGLWSGLLFFTVIGISLFRIYYILNGPLQLSPDEAHYWEWSRRLDLSYYSKGPLIAYLIHIGTSIFGDNVLGVRIMAVLFSALCSLFLYDLIWKMYNEAKIAMLGALLFQFIPLFAPFGIIFTIDSPFIFLWILSLYLSWIILNRTQHNPSFNSFYRKFSYIYMPWLLLGIVVGFGLLTKYTMFFFFLCGFLFLLFTEKKSLLLTPQPYLSLIVAILVFSPVLIWNSQNDWVTFKHSFGHLGVTEGLKISPKSFMEFILSQIGVVSPVIFFIMLYSLLKQREVNLKGGFLFYFSVPILLFFLIKSLQSKVQANWAMPAYVTGIIAFVVHYYDFKKNQTIRKISILGILFFLGILIALGTTVVSHYPSLLNLPVKLDPTSRLRGWKELGEEVSVIYELLSKKGETVIFSDSYQVSSELAFYVKGNPITYCINLGRRMNQYDLWEDINTYIEKVKKNKGDVQINAIFVRIGVSDMPEEMKEFCENFERKVFIVYDKGGNILRHYTIFICYNFKGFKTGKPIKF
ncbi:MAG: glycosyltransferase family 39 protein [Thermodesulfovibrionales bacterium]|nr:glycosyltransferase family 39 protein [Thermodesulfovibrionales bacterium]